MLLVDRVTRTEAVPVKECAPIVHGLGVANFFKHLLITSFAAEGPSSVNCDSKNNDRRLASSAPNASKNGTQWSTEKSIDSQSSKRALGSRTTLRNHHSHDNRIHVLI